MLTLPRSFGNVKVSNARKPDVVAIGRHKTATYVGP